MTPLHPKTTDGSRREEGAEGPHLPHGLVPVAPEALADALHAELELLEAVVPDHPAVVGLLARRGRDEVLGCKTGGGHAGSGSAGGVTAPPQPLSHTGPPDAHPEAPAKAQLTPEQPQLFKTSFSHVYFPPRTLGTLHPPKCLALITQLFKICQVTHK